MVVVFLFVVGLSHFQLFFSVVFSLQFEISVRAELLIRAMAGEDRQSGLRFVRLLSLAIRLRCREQQKTKDAFLFFVSSILVHRMVQAPKNRDDVSSWIMSISYCLRKIDDLFCILLHSLSQKNDCSIRIIDFQHLSILPSQLN